MSPQTSKCFTHVGLWKWFRLRCHTTNHSSFYNWAIQQASDNNANALAVAEKNGGWWLCFCLVWNGNIKNSRVFFRKHHVYSDAKETKRNGRHLLNQGMPMRFHCNYLRLENQCWCWHHARNTSHGLDLLAAYNFHWFLAAYCFFLICVKKLSPHGTPKRYVKSGFLSFLHRDFLYSESCLLGWLAGKKCILCYRREAHLRAWAGNVSRFAPSS